MRRIGHHVLLHWLWICGVACSLAAGALAQPLRVDLVGGEASVDGNACLLVNLSLGTDLPFALSVDINFVDAPVGIRTDEDCTLVRPDTGFTLACSDRTSGLIRCGVYDEQQPIVPLSDGELVRCCFTVNADASPGSYAVLNQCEAVDERGETIPVRCETGVIAIPVLEDTPTPLSTPSPTAGTTASATVVASCHGDCDSGGAVTINELVALVGVALGTLDVDACAAGDADRDGSISIDELVRAVNVALYGCAAQR